MVWRVAKGSFVNKLILVPVALALNAFAPWAVTPLLMIGGAYLCFEGVEKLAHFIWHRKPKTENEAIAELEQLKAAEGDEAAKIKGAIRTDFVLSAEIIVIALGVVREKPFLTELLTLSALKPFLKKGH